MLAFLDGLAGQMHGAQILNCNITVGRYFLTDGCFVVAPDVDNDFVAGPEDIVFGGGKVQGRLKGEELAVEDIVAPNLIFGVLFLQWKFGNIAEYVVSNHAALLGHEFVLGCQAVSVVGIVS